MMACTPWNHPRVDDDGHPHRRLDETADEYLQRVGRANPPGERGPDLSDNANATRRPQQ